MKPRDLKDGDACDRNGIPIHVGDLLQTFHYIDAATRRKCYIYTVVIISDGCMSLAPWNDQANRVCFLSSTLKDGVMSDAEVIDASISNIPKPLGMLWYERKRRKVTS